MEEPQTVEHWLQRCPSRDVLRQRNFCRPLPPLEVPTADPEKMLALGRATLNNNYTLHGWQTLGKGVLSIGVYRLLVGNRVGVGLTRSTNWQLLPSLSPFKGASK